MLIHLIKWTTDINLYNYLGNFLLRQFLSLEEGKQSESTLKIILLFSQRVMEFCVFFKIRFWQFTHIDAQSYLPVYKIIKIFKYYIVSSILVLLADHLRQLEFEVKK